MSSDDRYVYPPANVFFVRERILRFVLFFNVANVRLLIKKCVTCGIYVNLCTLKRLFFGPGTLLSGREGNSNLFQTLTA